MRQATGVLIRLPGRSEVPIVPGVGDSTDEADLASTGFYGRQPGFVPDGFVPESFYLLTDSVSDGTEYTVETVLRERTLDQVADEVHNCDLGEGGHVYKVGFGHPMVEVSREVAQKLWDRLQPEFDPAEDELPGFIEAHLPQVAKWWYGHMPQW